MTKILNIFSFLSSSSDNQNTFLSCDNEGTRFSGSCLLISLPKSRHFLNRSGTNLDAFLYSLFGKKWKLFLRPFLDERDMKEGRRDKKIPFILNIGLRC